MYANGNGVAQNYKLAYVWHSVAAANGDTDAPTQRDIVAKKLTTAVLADAQALAGQYFEKYQPQVFSYPCAGPNLGPFFQPCTRPDRLLTFRYSPPSRISHTLPFSPSTGNTSPSAIPSPAPHIPVSSAPKHYLDLLKSTLVVLHSYLLAGFPFLDVLVTSWGQTWRIY